MPRSWPRRADGPAPPASREAVGGYRLLGLSDPGDVWGTWSRRLLPDGPRLASSITFDAARPMYEAAASGLGLALGVRPLVTPFLAEGRLVEVPGTELRWPGACHTAALPRTLRAPPARALWTWLQAQAANVDRR